MRSWPKRCPVRLMVRKAGFYSEMALSIRVGKLCAVNHRNGQGTIFSWNGCYREKEIPSWRPERRPGKRRLNASRFLRPTPLTTTQHVKASSMRSVTQTWTNRSRQNVRHWRRIWRVRVRRIVWTRARSLRGIRCGITLSLARGRNRRGYGSRPCRNGWNLKGNLPRVHNPFRAPWFAPVQRARTSERS